MCLFKSYPSHIVSMLFSTSPVDIPLLESYIDQSSHTPCHRQFDPFDHVVAFEPAALSTS
ncbi:UDP-glycosyltransferase 88A1-like protein [Corchorus olitorius]|uniref:UDP-glycosyltransferase 88A1-like protein n=1 Tax=Corchorus olitorius TaxID=93759 RepID=A0A1R3KZB3_9ROSI|nr:UDP-glycosyltransferase 88A1-like protein [Corchorus olitorius]